MTSCASQSMQTCSNRAPFRSTFAGKATSARSQIQVLQRRVVHSRQHRLAVHAKIDTGYKKTVRACAQLLCAHQFLHGHPC